MKTAKKGLVIFWLGVVVMIAMGLVASFSAKAAYRDLSFDR